MNGTGTRIVKNAGLMMAAQLVTWMLSFLLAIFLPRYLGPAALGEYVIAGSIWAIMGMLIGFGMDTLLTKEIARQPEQTPALVGTAIILRVILFIMSCGLVALYVHLMAYPATTAYIIWIIGLSILLTQISMVCQSALQGLEAMKYTSLVGIVTKIIDTSLGIGVVLLGFGIYTVGYVTVISALVGAILLLFFLGRYYRPNIRFQVSSAIAMLRAGFPYLLSGLGLVLYGRVDVLIISSLLDHEQVGWYGSASQLFGTLLFIPVVFTTAIFPVLTRTYTNAPDTLPKILRKTFDMMLLVSIPLGLGLLAVADKLLVLLLGPAFLQSGHILALMGIVLIFTYQNVLIGRFLISTDRQNSWTVIMIIAVIATVPLDLVLVPWCQRMFGNGALAGAMSFIVTEFAMAAIGIWLLPKGSLGWSNVRAGVKIVFAGLVMAGVAWWLRDMFVVVPIAAGAITYLSLITILKVVPSEDIELFKQFGLGIVHKLRRRETKPVGITGV
jgi:O-antigen/teichoic acid export membrane protein